MKEQKTIRFSYFSVCYSLYFVRRYFASENKERSTMNKEQIIKFPYQRKFYRTCARLLLLLSQSATCPREYIHESFCPTSKHF